MSQAQTQQPHTCCVHSCVCTSLTLRAEHTHPISMLPDVSKLRPMSTKGPLKRIKSVNQKQRWLQVSGSYQICSHTQLRFISTGRIKSCRAAWYDTKATQTDGTCNCYTGTLIQADGSARNSFHKKLRCSRYSSFYSTSLHFSPKNYAGPHKWSCTELTKGSSPTSGSRASPWTYKPKHFSCTGHQFAINLWKWVTGSREMKQQLPRAALCMGGSSVLLWQQTSSRLEAFGGMAFRACSVCRQLWGVTFLSFTKHTHTIGLQMLKMLHCFSKHKSVPLY